MPTSFALANAIDVLLEECADDDCRQVRAARLRAGDRDAARARHARGRRAPARRCAPRSPRRRRRRGLRIGSAGTHPFSHWEDQRVVGEERYRELVSTLGFVARRELIFGMHVHVGLDDAETAIHVANGVREHIPLLLALSANSPFWRGEATGLASSRMPIFRGFPRVGVPPAYDGWADFERRIELMTAAGVIEDYTWMWYDVRPHPNLGTVEVRAMDAQTRVEHTLGLAALIQALVRELAEGHAAGERIEPTTDELLDANRWLAARNGLDGELVDLPDTRRVGTRELARALVERLEPHAQDLGSADELAAVGDLIERGNGAHRQRVVYEANGDFTEVVREVVSATANDA